MKKKFIKSFFTSFLVFALLYSGGAYYYINVRNQEAESSDNIFDRFMNDDGKDELTFLFLGVDTKDLSNDDKERSDTMMLCNVNKATGSVSILSIPRDTKVNIRGRKNEEKINHAHVYGGPELSIATVKDLLGIELDYYVRADYKIVEEFVNLIGGVEIDVPMDMSYSDLAADPPLRIDLKKGKQVLDGDKALQFLRFRKGYEDQDLGRINAQQEFIQASISQTLRPENIVKVPKMVEAYYKYIDTNIPFDTIMRFALKAKGINTENLDMVTLPGEPEMIGKVSYFIPYEDEMYELVKNMFTDHKTVENKYTDEDEEEETN